MADGEIIFAVEESPEGGYEAKALGYPIFTQADNLQELKAMLQDAVRCHFDVTVPRHKEVKIGTLGSIPTELSTYLETSKEELADDLFGSG